MCLEFSGYTVKGSMVSDNGADKGCFSCYFVFDLRYKSK